MCDCDRTKIWKWTGKKQTCNMYYYTKTVVFMNYSFINCVLDIYYYKIMFPYGDPIFTSFKTFFSYYA